MNNITYLTESFKIIRRSIKTFTLFSSIPSLLIASYDPKDLVCNNSVTQNHSRSVHESMSDESPLQEEDKTTYQPSSLHLLPNELMLHILQFLPVNDLNRLSTVSKDLKMFTDDQTLWWPLYQKAQLTPYLELSKDINPHVASYRYLMTAVHIVQKALMKGQEPYYEVLIKATAQAFQDKVWLYHVFSKIYASKGEWNQAQTYSNMFRIHCLSGEDFNQAVFSGFFGFNSISETERFDILKLREQSGDQDAQKWVDQALFEGQLSQQHRPFTERLVEIKQRIEMGNQNALNCLIYKIAEDHDFAQNYGTELECFNFLEHQSHQGHASAQQTVIKALYGGHLGQHQISEHIRYKKLKEQADKGNVHAQSYVEQALLQGTLGQQDYSEQERFEMLSSLSWKTARTLVIHTLTQGSLGQEVKPILERMQEIERMLISERLHHTMYCHMIFSGQGLGQENVSEIERFAHLEDLATHDIKEAEQYIIQALYEGKLGQNLRSDKDRFNELIQRAHNGSNEAAQAIANAFHYGELSQNMKSADQRYHALKYEADQGNTYAQQILPKIINRGGLLNNRFGGFMDGFLGYGQRNDRVLQLSDGLLLTLRQDAAKQGDERAQKWLNQTLYEGTYGQDSSPPSERFNRLYDQALKGDQDAENYIVKALIRGELGQSQRPLIERFTDLDFWAYRNNRDAQQAIAQAIKEGTFDQDQLTYDDRIQVLKDRGQWGNTYAYDMLIDILIFGQLDQFQRSPEDRFNEIRALSQSGHPKAQQILVQLLSIEIRGLFDRIQGIGYTVDFLENDQETDSERYQELKTLALNGNSYARKTLIESSHLFLKSPQDRMSNLLFWAALGDHQAQHLIINNQGQVLQNYSQNLRHLYELLTIIVQPGGKLFK